MIGKNAVVNPNATTQKNKIKIFLSHKTILGDWLG